MISLVTPAPVLNISKNSVRTLNHESHVLVTGATGMIGGEVARAIDQYGVRSLFCLVRHKDHSSAEGRLRARFLRSSAQPIKAEAIGGDLTDSRLGLSDDDFERIIADVDVILHCAAETSFIHEEACEKVNIEGTRHLIAMAKKCRKIPLLIFVSTACNGGKNINSCLHEDDGCRPEREHHNSYTYSKAVSELMVHDSGLPYLVVRPTIVFSSGINDAGFARQILWFAPLLKELTHLPINPKSRMDMTPVSFVADSLMSLATKHNRSQSLYNLSAGNSYSVSVETFFEIICRTYGIPAINFVPEHEWSKEVRRSFIKTPLQRKIYFALRYYFPFFNCNVIYDNGRLAQEIGPLGIPHLANYLPEVLKQISWSDGMTGSDSP